MSVSQAYAFWQEFTFQSNVNSFPCLSIANFNFHDDEYIFGQDTIVVNVDDEFKEKYVEEINGVLYLNDTANEELRKILPAGSIIKSDIYYEILSSSYILTNHNILPDASQGNIFNYVMRPISLDYISTWAYDKNRVVRASDGNYYVSADNWNTSNPADPSSNRWYRIEPMNDDDFYTFLDSQIPNYRTPILSRIFTSIIWTEFSLYNVGDIVVKENDLTKFFISKNTTRGAEPSSNNWAWREATESEVENYRNRLILANKLPSFMS